MTDDGFRTFVEQRYATLLRTAYLLTGSAHAAEDLLQSALLSTMSRWRSMDHPEAYVRRVMVNELVSRWRRRRLVEVLTAALPERAAPQPDDPELRDELWQALRRLPAGMRAVLVLRFWEDLSEAQIAEALGCSVGTVKSQTSRGLARLRELVRPVSTVHTGGQE
jgi:RNA polymerase sigma-70 factor (sigma-E family)